MNQARDERAEAYALEQAESTGYTKEQIGWNDAYQEALGAHEAGWDAALEFLRGKESLSQFFSEQLKHYQDGLKGLEKESEHGFARMNLIAADFWDFIQEASRLAEANSALKERIRELENERSKNENRG